MKSDWRISIKAYRRNKSLKVTLASRRAGQRAVVLTPHPGQRRTYLTPRLRPQPIEGRGGANRVFG